MKTILIDPFSCQRNCPLQISSSGTDSKPSIMQQRIIQQRSNIWSDKLIFRKENMPFRAALSRMRFLAQKELHSILKY